MNVHFLKLISAVCCFTFYTAWGYSTDFERIENTERIMSYNVRNALGMDNQRDYQRIADVILRVSPDVVAVQELDSVTERSQGVDALARLADLTKMYSVYGASIDYQGGKYGIGILSKEKPLSWERIPLPGSEEKRSLLMVELEKYIFCCTHFSLKEPDRLASVAIINDYVQKFGKPVFLAGDINATPDSPVLSAFQKTWKILSNPKQLTSPADKPVRTIDYIFGYTGKQDTCSVLQTRVLNEPVASDHLPLFADIRLRADKNAIFKTKPYLQNPAVDAVTVMWQTYVPCYSWIEYGEDSTRMKRERTSVEGEAMANNQDNRIRLSGLKPGTKYYYRVCSREITLYEPYRKEFGATATSPVSSFITLDDNKKAFTAIIFNDIHDNYALFDKLCSQIKDVPYDIVFFNGDCIADVQSERNAVRSISHYSEKIKADAVPSIYLRGNHETRGAYSMFLWNLLEKVGGQHSYCAFNIGDTRFVLLDAGEDKPDDHWVYYGLNDFTQYRKDQAEFLRKETASKAFRSASRRVLLYHIPTYGLGESFCPACEEWNGILSKANFDICFNAHTHKFNYIQKGKEGNNFPVIIGGGSNEKSATVMILQKKEKEMNLKVLNVNGEELLTLDL